MFDVKIKKTIIDFVYSRPRTVDEIAKLIGKNWRTADRYIQRIADEDGSISMRTFREGTRGALKVVFWSNIESINSSTFQDALLRQIQSGKVNEDFDPFDIYQYVDDDKKNAFIENFKNPNISLKQFLIPFLERTDETLFVFSGNLSIAHIVENKKPVLSVIERLAASGVNIKILCRVDFATIENVKKLLELNNKLGKEMIEIRHCKQPLRGFIVDDKIARFLEEKLVQNEENNQTKNMRLFMELQDKDWISWLKNVFYVLYRTSIDANKRISQLERIK